MKRIRTHENSGGVDERGDDDEDEELLLDFLLPRFISECGIMKDTAVSVHGDTDWDCSVHAENELIVTSHKEAK